MATLTFKELQMFNEILKPDFKPEDFTPSFFYNLTKFQTSYNYVDILMFLKHVQKLRTDDKYNAHLNTVLGRENYGTKEVSELENLFSSALLVKNFLMSGDSQSYNRIYTDPSEDFESTISQRFKNMRLAATKTGNLTANEEWERFTFVTYEELKNKLKTVLTKGINESYIGSLYNQKIAGDFDKERSNAIKEYNNFLRRKRQEIVDDALTYDNFFNVIYTDYITSSQTINIRNWCVSPNSQYSPFAFFSKTDKYGNKTWKESFLGDTNTRVTYNEKHPTSAVLHDIFMGNMTSVEDFPTPMFHNDKFSHYINIPKFTRFTYGLGDTLLKYPEVVKYLNTKGFKVRTRIERSQGGYRTVYNKADVILSCWNCSSNDYKIEHIKQSISYLTAFIACKFSDVTRMKRSNVRYEPGGCLENALFGIYNSIPETINQYCNFLKYLYISETDLKVKTVIEAAIFTVRETYKREYGDYFKTINTSAKKREIKIGLNSMNSYIQKFHKLNAMILNDDSYPQGILKSTNKIDEMKLNITRHTARRIGQHCNFSYDTKVNEIGERAEKMRREYDTLSKSWSKADKVKADELRKHMEVFSQEAVSTMSEIYTNSTKDANGVWHADIRTDEHSLPVTLDKIVQARGAGDMSGYTQSEEELQRIRNGEGIQNDNNVELSEFSREQCHIAHEHLTGKKIADDKIGLATVPVESQVPINPDYSETDAQADAALFSEQAESVRAIELQDRRIIAREQKIARGIATVNRAVQKVIDFFTN